MASAEKVAKRKKRRAKIKKVLGKVGKGLAKVATSVAKVGLKVGGKLFLGPAGSKMADKVGGVLDKVGGTIKKIKGKSHKGKTGKGVLGGIIGNIGKRKKSSDGLMGDDAQLIEDANDVNNGGIASQLKIGAGTIFKRLKMGAPNELDENIQAMGQVPTTNEDGSPLSYQNIEIGQSEGVATTPKNQGSNMGLLAGASLLVAGAAAYFLKSKKR
jgi:hypothetical protein